MAKPLILARQCRTFQATFCAEIGPLLHVILAAELGVDHAAASAGRKAITGLCTSRWRTSRRRRFKSGARCHRMKEKRPIRARPARTLPSEAEVVSSNLAASATLSHVFR